MIESNCIFVKKETYHRLGGYDEQFDLPGGGFANIDFFKRAAELAETQLVCLLGKDSFHQIHGGTTT